MDPKGVYDLVWRVHGRNRIEVQMPLPPKGNAQLRRNFLEARKKLFEANITRSDLERIFAATPDERPGLIEKLAGQDPERLKRIRTAVQRYDEYTRALKALRAAEQGQPATAPAGTQPASKPALEELKLALRDATEALEDAIEQVLETNLDPQRFQDILEMDRNSPARKQNIELLKQQHPTLAALIDQTVTAYDRWRSKRVYLESPADLRRLLRGAGVLEFRILAKPSPENATRFNDLRRKLKDEGPRTARDSEFGWFRIDNPMSFLNLNSLRELEQLDPATTPLPYVIGRRGSDWYVLAYLDRDHCMLQERGWPKWRLVSVRLTRDRLGRRAVGFTFDTVGGDLFGELTGKNIGESLCILVDDVAYSAATIQSRIRRNGIIEGDFSAEKLNYLIQTMQAGSLPARLKDTPISERVIGSSLGETNLRKAFRAGVWGLIAVGVLMMVYYWFAGAIANVALLMNILLVLAVMAFLHARITLAGIAGIILTVGMSVDANVLIFERMREEKQRGASLRMVIKNGYDKALSTILDANITTLLTCIIIYYVGSEEIRGFGLTLGWGIVTSLFTALFVTRTLFMLLIRYNVIRDVGMLQLIGVPNIDWYGKRKFFLPLSAATMALGLFLLYERGTRDTLDVEFLGGINAEVEINKAVADQYDDVRIRELLEQTGREIAAQGEQLAQAQVAPVPGDPTAYTVAVPGISPARLAAMITEPLEEGESGQILERGGVDVATDRGVTVHVRSGVTAEKLKAALAALADRSGDSIPLDGENIARANINRVSDIGEQERTSRFWRITTTVTNRTLVEHALISALGNAMQTRPRVAFVYHGPGGRQEPWPITSKRLEEVIPDLPAGVTADLTDYVGGAAMYFMNLDPPQAVDPDVTGSIADRIESMRLQPDFEDLPYHPVKVIGIERAGSDPEGHPLYRSVVIVTVDPAFSYNESPQRWLSEFAGPELDLAIAALSSEQTLRHLTQFKPQIATQAKTQALIALILSWAMIIGYLWIRFGKPIYGIAGVAALIHDVLIALAFVGISGWIGGSGHPVGQALLIDDFKIDMTIVAAFLTIIGYSINDTIVVFDRIRETRGRLGRVTREVINKSINHTISRTLLTSFTTLLVLLIMYIFGGNSIRGFNYCMIIGVLTGTYSSIAVASPLLMAAYARRTAAAPAAAPA